MFTLSAAARRNHDMINSFRLLWGDGSWRRLSVRSKNFNTFLGNGWLANLDAPFRWLPSPSLLELFESPRRDDQAVGSTTCPVTRKADQIGGICPRLVLDVRFNSEIGHAQRRD